MGGGTGGRVFLRHKAAQQHSVGNKGKSSAAVVALGRGQESHQASHMTAIPSHVITSARLRFRISARDWALVEMM